MFNNSILVYARKKKAANWRPLLIPMWLPYDLKYRANSKTLIAYIFNIIYYMPTYLYKVSCNRPVNNNDMQLL